MEAARTACLLGHDVTIVESGEVVIIDTCVRHTH